MKLNIANLTLNYDLLFKCFFMATLFFLANETPAQMQACQLNYKQCSNQSNIQSICESKSDEAVGKCIVEYGGGSCLADKIASNNSNWESCTVVDNHVNWNLYDKQNHALQVCFPSRYQVYNSCMQSFYSNPLSWPQPNPMCSIEFNQCMNNINRPQESIRP